MQKTIDAILRKIEATSVLKSKVKVFESELRDLKTDLASNFVPNWSVTIIADEMNRPFLKDMGAIRILLKIENSDEWDTLHARLENVGFCISPNHNKDSYVSVPYFYMDGFIYSDGGGQIILKDPTADRYSSNFDCKIPCSTEEWQSILTGEIPTKFLSDHAKGLLNIDETSTQEESS